MEDQPATSPRPWLTWAGRAVSAVAILVVLWACVTQWGAVMHGNPAYAILLAITVVVAAWALWHSFTRRKRRSGWRLVLRPLAESGYTVVIPKQPLGIAFLSLGAFDKARPSFPGIDMWVVGGHSLGGTVAAMEADSSGSGSAGGGSGAPAVGLLFFASYPAGDISESLTASVESISGSQDGLAMPAKIDASRVDLPAASNFTQIEGAVHAQFGDYGPQPGDGVPTISDDDARNQISEAALAYLESLVPGLP